MLSVQEALNQLISAFGPLEAETVPLRAAAGRVLAKPVFAPFDLPQFINSSMDGFAVRAEDIRTAKQDHPVDLQVVADVPAGQPALVPVTKGTAVRIMTGAPLPEGADAVVPVEDTDCMRLSADSPLPSGVKIFKAVQSGDYLRQKGQDVQHGEMILDRGIRLHAQEVGLLAMIGVTEVEVVRKPCVALISSGDELTEIGQPLTPGKIYDANTYTLATLVEKYGGDVEWVGIASDQREVIQEFLDRAVEAKADLILSSAGVSVGAFDFIRHVVQAHGKLDFWKVNMRPGKPLAFGSYRNVPFIGLPGNPVSAFVGFEVFVRPVLLIMSGIRNTDRHRLKARLIEAIESDGRESYLRAVVSETEQREWVVRLTGHQGSGNLRSLVQANAFLIVPSEVKSLPIGVEVEVWLFDYV